MFALALSVALFGLSAGMEVVQRSTLTSAQSVSPQKQPTKYACSGAVSPAVAAACELCKSDFAFYVENDEVQSLRPLLSPDSYLALLTVVSDIASHVPPSNFTIAGDAPRLCVSVSEMLSEPQLLDMFQYFGGMQYAQLAVPEVFQLQGATYFNYMSVAMTYAESQLVYEEAQFRFDAPALAKVATNITLDLDHFTVSSQSRIYTVRFEGTTQIRQARIPFSITMPYNRKPGTNFRVNVAVNGQYTVRDWMTFTAHNSDCLALQLPPGISSLMPVPVLFSGLDFHFNSDKKEAELSQMVIFFGVPPFALAPGVFMQRPYGQYQVDSATSSCTLYFGSIVDLGFSMEALVVSDKQSWYITGGLAPPATALTPREVERLIPRLFVVPSDSLFPQYGDGGINVGEVLADRNITNPKISIFYHPGAYINVIGDALWAEDRVAELQIMVGTVNNVVESVLTLEQPTLEATLPGDSDIGTGNLTTVFSTGNVELNAYPYMKGVRGEAVEAWQVGTYAYATLTRAEECLNAFCQLLKSATSKKKFNVSGNLIDGQMNLRGKFKDYHLMEGVEMRENDIVMEFTEDRPLLYLQGAFYIQSDSSTLNRFAGNVTDVDGSAHLCARLENIWTSVFAYPSVYITSLEAEGEVVNGKLQAKFEGLAFLGANCYTPWSGFDTNDCLLTRVSVSLDPTDYRKNSLTLRTNGLSTEAFLRFIVGTTVYQDVAIPMAMRGLDVSSSLDISVNYTADEKGNKVGIIGSVKYYGVDAWMQGSMTTLGAGKVQIAADLQEFSMAEGNIFVETSPEGLLHLDLSFDSRGNSATGKITAGIELWGIYDSTNIVISDTGATIKVQGRPFLGLYTVQMLVSSEELTDLKTSSFSVRGTLCDVDRNRLQWSVRQDLIFWVAQGTDSLATALNWANNATVFEASMDNEACEARQCPVSPFCERIPATECRAKAQVQSCDTEKPVCSTPQATCTAFSEECIVPALTCADSEEEECVDWATQCQESINVCREWTQACEELPLNSCSAYKMTEQSETCLEYQTSCAFTPRQDSSCVSACKQSILQAEAAEATSANYTAALELVNRNLSDFHTLSLLLPRRNFDILSIESVQLTSPLNEAGIGEKDITVEVTFQTINLTSQQMETATITTSWDFQEELLNEISLFAAVKSRIIASSSLSPRLESATPFELLIEAFYQQ